MKTADEACPPLRIKQQLKTHGIWWQQNIRTSTMIFLLQKSRETVNAMQIIDKSNYKLPANIRVGIVNVSVAGCKIELFDKTNYQSYASTAASWMTGIIDIYSGNPYAHLVEMAKLAQKDGVIKGILLHQGESNTNDKDWPIKVKAIYDDLIKDLFLKAEEVPLLAGELVNADQGGTCASMNSIINELPKTIPNSYIISSKGCTSRPDHLHFNAAGYRELGMRYGLKMLSLLGYRVDEPE